MNLGHCFDLTLAVNSLTGFSGPSYSVPMSRDCNILIVISSLRKKSSSSEGICL